MLESKTMHQKLWCHLNSSQQGRKQLWTSFLNLPFRFNQQVFWIQLWLLKILYTKQVNHAPSTNNLKLVNLQEDQRSFHFLAKEQQHSITFSCQLTIATKRCPSSRTVIKLSKETRVIQKETITCSYHSNLSTTQTLKRCQSQLLIAVVLSKLQEWQCICLTANKRTHSVPTRRRMLRILLLRRKGHQLSKQHFSSQMKNKAVSAKLSTQMQMERAHLRISLQLRTQQKRCWVALKTR